MKVLRPLLTNRVNQRFGESQACVSLSVPRRIVDKRGTCPAGYTDFYTAVGLLGHNGWDFACWYGEPVYFPVIADTEWFAEDATDRSGGIGVDVISRSQVYNGNYVKFRFWHLRQELVEDGQTIKPGDLLGYGNSTGASSANHLHFGMKPCDQAGHPIAPQNGYAGCEDFAPLYENRFILDELGIKTGASDYLRSLLKTHL